MVYDSLLLSAGGGIVSAQQQADQAKDTATVLIGLGGTGIDCLRTIKTQVYSRLKADDPDAIEPSYSHIRFLGVDADNKSQNKGSDVDAADNKNEDAPKVDALLALGDTEFFSIANSDVIQALAKKQVLDKRDELRWLRSEEIPKTALGEAGAGGVRQVGRFLLMDRSDDFMTRVESEINAAKIGLRSPQVYVHIFTGLSGGTGAGCFLDVCYMVQDIAARLGGSITTLGYFFLPDVNLARIPMAKTNIRDYVPVNGYASMQELDYCMNLQYNGGAFTQTYKGGSRIKWEKPPVQIAHLICATNANREVIPRAYEYAMNVTAEYVMDFLTYDTSDFGLSSQLSNFENEVSIADGKKGIGSNLRYCALGASCASLPLRQVNTYLASELFARFASIGGNVPTKSDVDLLAREALSQAGMQGIYESLWVEIQEGAGDGYVPYQDDWRYVYNYGNRDLVESYTKQTASKCGTVERNARSLKEGANEGSLFARTTSALTGVIRDLQRGPLFAHRLLDAAQSYSLLNVIDGLIEQNRLNWEQEGAQTQRLNDYENAKDDFEKRRKHSLLDNDRKRFAEYKHYLRLLEEHKYLLAVYEQLDSVLHSYRKQVEGASRGYYLKLARVTANLVETFAENRDALASERTLGGEDGFSEPLMTIAELKGPMDDEIRRINVAGMLDAFMSLLLDNPDVWLQENEHKKIARLVTRFFVDTAFGDFANRSITAFLRDKYQTTTDEELANRIYKDWMVKLTSKAAPLFCFDHGVMSVAPKPGDLACLSVPMTSAPIKAAALQMQSVDDKWQVKDSALTDRIYVMGSSAALPLAGYNNNALYEVKAFSNPGPGRHYYETPDLKGMRFSDWNGLAPLTPQQLVVLEDVPKPVRSIVERGQKLFDRGYQAGLIDDNNYIHEFRKTYLDDFHSRIKRAEEIYNELESVQEIPLAQEVIDSLANIGEPITTPTEFHMQNDGNLNDKDNHRLVAKDHFVSSPVFQIMIESSLSELEKLQVQSADIQKRMKDRIRSIKDKTDYIEQYMNALFTGVVSIEGNTVVYHHVEYGITSDIVLSEMGPEYPFGKVSIYQGLKSFGELDANLRNEIGRLANERLNSVDSELLKTGERLKALLSDDRINAWSRLAANFSNQDEIIKFLKEFRKAFEVHCDIYLVS